MPWLRPVFARNSDLLRSSDFLSLVEEHDLRRLAETQLILTLQTAHIRDTSNKRMQHLARRSLR